MRLASVRSASLASFVRGTVSVSLLAASSLLTGCPEKGGAPADKTQVEPEHAEPDDQGKIDEKSKKPAAVAPAPAPSADDKKPDDGKDEGGW